MNKTQKIAWVVLSFLPFFIICLALILLGVKVGNSILISIPSWIVIYFFFIGKSFWVEVAPNYGVVLQNYFKKESAGNSTTTTEKTQTDSSDEKNKVIRIPNGQRAVFTGLNMKLPWEFLAAPAISLVKETKCEGTISVQGKEDKFRYSVNYKCPLTPVANIYLPRYLMVEEETAIAFFRSHVESAIRKMFTEESGDEICADYKKYSKKYLATLFGGDDEIVHDENYYGRFTNTPFLADVKIEKSGQDAAEVGAKATKLASAIKLLTNKGMSANVAAALLEGKDVELIDIGGNVNPALAGFVRERKKGKK